MTRQVQTMCASESWWHRAYLGTYLELACLRILHFACRNTDAGVISLCTCALYRLTVPVHNASMQVSSTDKRQCHSIHVSLWLQACCRDLALACDVKKDNGLLRAKGNAGLHFFVHTPHARVLSTCPISLH